MRAGGLRHVGLGCNTEPAGEIFLRLPKDPLTRSGLGIKCGHAESIPIEGIRDDQ